MSHFSVHNGALNSGAINHVSFPGAESGKSLIQLVGDVEVTCALTSIYLLKTASAVTTPSATPSESATKIRALLSATQSAQAVSSSGALTKLRTVPVQQAAFAETAVVARLNRRLAASSSGVATVSTIGGYARATRTAAISAAAAVFAFAFRYAPRSASTSGVAVSSAAALRKALRSASTTASATCAATVNFKYRPVASVSAAAAGVIPTRVNVRRLANTAGVAVGSSPLALRKRIAELSPTIAAAVAQVLSERHRKPNAALTSGVAQNSAQVAFKFKLGANAVAEAIAASAAEDYAVAAPAPVERLMTVPASDRRMEVTL